MKHECLYEGTNGFQKCGERGWLCERCKMDMLVRAIRDVVITIYPQYPIYPAYLQYVPASPTYTGGYPGLPQTWIDTQRRECE